MRSTVLMLAAAFWMASPISNSAQELANENKIELLVSDYRTIVAIEHASATFITFRQERLLRILAVRRVRPMKKVLKWTVLQVFPSK